MKKFIDKHWRDAIAIVTVGLIITSLFLINYGIQNSNRIADKQRQQIACVVSFFTHANRANTVITNINNCSLEER